MENARKTPQRNFSCIIMIKLKFWRMGSEDIDITEKSMNHLYCSFLWVRAIIKTHLRDKDILCFSYTLYTLFFRLISLAHAFFSAWPLETRVLMREYWCQGKDIKFWGIKYIKWCIIFFARDTIRVIRRYLGKVKIMQMHTSPSL